MKNMKISSKKLISVCLILCLILGMSLTGCKKNKPDDSASEEPGNVSQGVQISTDNSEKQDTGKGSAESLYQDFLDGKAVLHANLGDKSELLIDDLLLYAMENYDFEAEAPKLTEVSYSMIDCGSDGIPELALQTVLDSDGMMVTEWFVIKEIGQELKLCHSGSSMNWMQSSLFANGMVTDSTSFGISAYVNDYTCIDKDGNVNYVYGETVSYQAYSILDDRFDRDVISKDERLFDAYLKSYSFDSVENYANSEEWDRASLYCADKDDDEPSNGVNFEENKKVIQEVFDQFGVKLCDLSEIKDKMAEKRSSLGLNKDNLEFPEIEWKVLSVDTDALNKNYADSRTSTGTAFSGDTFASEEDLTEFLSTGTWLYFEPGTDVDNGDSSLSIVFSKDGTFRGVKTPEDTNDIYSFEGEWSLDRLLRSEDEVPDYIYMKLTSCDDPAFENFGAFGGYALENFGILNGNYVMALQREGEDEIMFSGVANPILYKTGVERVETPRCDFEEKLIHDVDLWRVESGDETTFYVSPAAKFGISEIMPVVELTGRSDSNSEYGFDAFKDNGIYHVSVTLDENGRVDNIYPRSEEIDFCVAQKPVINDPSDTIRGYLIKKYDYTVYSPEGGRVLAYFEMPVLGGYGDVVDELNESIENMRRSYQSDIESDDFKEMCDMALGMDPTGEFMYRPCRLNGVFTNDKYVSICFYWDWCMGGVYNSGCSCLNRDINTGEKVTLDKLMGIPMDEVKDRIADVFEEEYSVDYGYSGETIRGIINDMDAFDFHFDNSQIFVEFESYALDLGPSSFTLRLEY